MENEIHHAHLIVFVFWEFFEKCWWFWDINGIGNLFSEQKRLWTSICWKKASKSPLNSKRTSKSAQQSLFEIRKPWFSEIFRKMRKKLKKFLWMLELAKYSVLIPSQSFFYLLEAVCWGWQKLEEIFWQNLENWKKFVKLMCKSWFHCF